MKTHTFDLTSDENLILLPVVLDGYDLMLALDTAATHSIIDWNVLMMLGYSEVASKETHLLETANGVIKAQTFEVNTVDILGQRRENFTVLSYDFLQKGILSSYDGVVGLDFFRFSGVLTIDFKRQKLWLEN